jgi:hypothetical protein
MRHLGFDATVSGRHGPSAALRLTGDALGTWTTVGPMLRLAVFAPRVFYLGVEGQFGLAHAPGGSIVPTQLDASGRAVPAPAFALSPDSPQLSHSIGAIAGVSVPVWRFDLSLEVFGGVRALKPSFSFASPGLVSGAAGGCWKSDGGSTCPSVDFHSAYAPRIEPRAGLAFRITPWVTVRALGGVEPLVRGAFSATALIELHLRSYDGFYPRQIID